jgi:hypothetical protein
LITARKFQQITELDPRRHDLDLDLIVLWLGRYWYSLNTDVSMITFFKAECGDIAF